MTMTLSLMERAYMWFSITWLGRGRRVGSHDRGVSLFRMTWRRCGGRMGGPPPPLGRRPPVEEGGGGGGVIDEVSVELKEGISWP